MSKKRIVKPRARLEAGLNVWKEVLEAIREIKAGGGKRTVRQPRSPIARARIKAGLTQTQFARLLGVSPRTLEQWEQGRREPSGAAQTLIRVAVAHPKILRGLAA